MVWYSQYSELKFFYRNSVSAWSISLEVVLSDGGVLVDARATFSEAETVCISATRCV